jgi:hypothetical protein
MSRVYSLIFGSDLEGSGRNEKFFTTKFREKGRRLDVVHIVYCDLGIWLSGRTLSFTSLFDS